MPEEKVRAFIGLLFGVESWVRRVVGKGAIELVWCDYIALLCQVFEKVGGWEVG